MVDEVFDLHLELVLKLTLLGHNLLGLGWLSEILVVFGKKMHFADVGPRVEPIAHWVLGP